MNSNLIYTKVLLLFSMLVSLSCRAQDYAFDLDGRLAATIYTDGTQVKYASDAAGNVFGISSGVVPNTNAPVVTILTPTSGSTTTISPLAISGTASGANQVIFVLFQVNNGLLQMATTVNNWTNWTASASLFPGTNILTFYALDSAGNTGSNRFIVFFTPPPLWTPMQLGTNLTLWLDAAASNSFTLNGNNVSQWNDLSGYGNAVANADSASEPRYEPAGLSNLPTVDFYSQGLSLVSSQNFGVSGAAPRALAAIMNCGMIGTGNPAPVSEAFGFDLTAGGHVWVPYFYGSGDIDTYAPQFSSNDSILFGQYYNGICSGYANGSFYGSNTVAPNTVPWPIELGTRSDGQSRVGKISEIIYVSAGLPFPQQQRLEGYLAWKWGLETNLPSNHPYRYAAPLNAAVSVPSINASFTAGVGLQIHFIGVPGYTYILQTATNLGMPMDWQPVATNSPDNNGNWRFTDTNSATLPSRFYRVVVSQ